MPELPEVHTTTEGLKKFILNKTIKKLWSDFHIDTSVRDGKNIKNYKIYKKIKKIAEGAKILEVERIGKNILIHILPSIKSFGEYTLLIHMKMTGHLMYGKYQLKKEKNKSKKIWRALEKGPLQDSYNQYIHLVASLSCGKHLVLSDMRKFASVTIIKRDGLKNHESISVLGPDALKISFDEFKERLKKFGKNSYIKSALLDQSIISGIGNIYSDEILFETGIHPLSQTNKINDKKMKEIFDKMVAILNFSIKNGGDSKSDYRNILGEKGGFQNFHKAYGRKGLKCPKQKCGGIIDRMVVKTRSSHFCPKHQKLIK